MGVELIRRPHRYLLVGAVLPVLVLVAIAAGFHPGRARGPMFDEEFNGPGLDGDRWATCFFWRAESCSNGSSDRQSYVPGNVSTSDGVLSLTARRGSTRRFLQDGTSGMVPYSSGMISSEGRFQFRYGYVEIRARVPKGRGLWPALWLMPADHSWPPEIDIMENVGQETDRVTFTNHPPDAANKVITVAGTDYAAGFHTFAVDWQPDHLTYLVDGVPRGSLTDHIPSKAMYVIANLGVGGPWPGNPDAATAFPATFAVDYIKVWKSGGGIPVGAYVPTAGRAS